MALVDELIAAWSQDQVCLHPTDTIPGLSFNPDSPTARARLFAIKNREAQKACISLVSSLQVAGDIWQKLPTGWEELLTCLWPGALTVVWQAKKPSLLTNIDGSFACRQPKFTSQNLWMDEVLSALAKPFPSTSVNLSARKPLVQWQEACAFAREHDIFVPRLECTVRHSIQDASSTIIKILPSGDFEVIREGAFAVPKIRKEWNRVYSCGT